MENNNIDVKPQFNMAPETSKEERNTPEYLAQLLKDKKQIQAFPNVFIHLERLLDEEILKVRGSLFHFGDQKQSLALPEPKGPQVTLQEKMFVPVKDHPDFNFVGRILGPRGMTAKQLEQETGCKIMVRGKGSMRDKKKEELNRGKPNWEHLNEDLHVLITVEDTRNRAEIKLKRAVEEVRRLLVPAPEGEDELKKMQLMELAIINGTYRTNEQLQAAQLAMAQKLQAVQGPRILAPALTGPISPAMRSPQPQGAPIFLGQAPRFATNLNPAVSQATANHLASMAATSQGLMSVNGAGAPPPLVSPNDAGLLYGHYDPYSAAALANASMLDFPAGLDQSAAGTSAYVR